MKTIIRQMHCNAALDGRQRCPAGDAENAGVENAGATTEGKP